MPVHNHCVPCMVHLYVLLFFFNDLFTYIWLISYLFLCAGPNPCAEDNGGCSYLCLLSAVAADGYTCTCPHGLVLDAHGKNCSGTYKTTVIFCEDISEMDLMCVASYDQYIACIHRENL